MASPVKPSAQKVRKGPVSLRLRTYTMELDSGGDDQVCYGDAFVLVDTATGMTMNNGVSNQSGYVKSLVIHVGGTRCVTIDRSIQRHTRITRGVELIRFLYV